jgi:MFS transporter, FSR family, fosmidomycin resistance protein
MRQNIPSVQKTAPSTMKRRAVWTFSGSHLFNDLVTTGMVSALLPLYKMALHINYTQLGLIVLCSYLMSSISQPLFGAWTDKRPTLWFLPLGVFVSCVGLALTGMTSSYGWVLVFISLSGLGSGAFHPEAARGTHLAGGNRKGLAQAIFQVGGNSGQALGPLVVALGLKHTGIHGLVWVLLVAGLALLLGLQILPWYRKAIQIDKGKKQAREGRNRVGLMALLVVIIIVRSWCQVGVSSFLPFLAENNHQSFWVGEWHSFVFLAFGALGTFIGGVLSAKTGNQRLLTASILLSIPFSLLFPHLHGVWALLDICLFGFTILSSFAVTVVYAQSLLPKNVAMASGLTIGFGVGAGGIGATLMGSWVDVHGVGPLFTLISFLPILAGILCFLLPSDKPRHVHPV